MLFSSDKIADCRKATTFASNMEKHHSLIKKTLEAMGFEALKPMQEEALKQYSLPNDLILLSPTGSGKTLAFLLPMVGALQTGHNGVQTLIIVPSRELALQIERVFRSMQTGYKITCLYGGHDIKVEKKSLSEAPAVIVGTPGRILDHLEQGSFLPGTIRTLILDEFDKALELGFTEEMSAIIEKLPRIKKRILTSATDGTEIPEYTGLKDPITLSFLEESNIRKGVTLKQVKSPIPDKLDTLYKLICELGEGSKLVFCNYRESAERVSHALSKEGIPNAHFHGGMEQVDRENALIKFRNGSTNVFVSTDLAARGLDIPEIRHIIHYHLPVNEEAFVHRNGRTARMNAEGNAYLILGPNEYLPEYIRKEPAFQSLSEVTPAPAKPEWVTLYIGKGKKDKLSKMDIVGFLIQKGELEKNDLGVIDVKEFHAYAAIRASKVHGLLKKIHGLKIKNMKTKFEISR